MPHLLGLQNLEHLKLNDTQVGDTGFLQLRALKHLKSLDVHRTLVTPAAIEELKKELPGIEVSKYQD
jgi:hypothetical protein